MNRGFERITGLDWLQLLSKLPKGSRVVFVSMKTSIAKKQGYGRTQEHADKSQGFYPRIALAPCLPYPAALLKNSFIPRRPVKSMRPHEICAEKS
jgi:hypothetical protein